MGVSIRYRELDEMSREFGAYLQHVAGLRKGDRIALMLPNLLQYRLPCSARCAPGWSW